MTVKVETLPPSAAERLSRDMRVCPTCGKAVRPDQSIVLVSEFVIYHRQCWCRRVIQ